MAVGLLASSCLKSEIDDYEEWRKVNDAYVAAIDTTEYQPITPSWAPFNTVYVKWHNDRSLTAKNLVPISTSTIRCKYILENIDGTLIQNSFKSNGDSIFESVVNNTVIGFQAVLTNMHVGDSVTAIIPYPSGYGSANRGSNLRPYTNLIYHMKLVSLPYYERPAK